MTTRRMAAVVLSMGLAAVLSKLAGVPVGLGAFTAGLTALILTSPRRKR